MTVSKTFALMAAASAATLGLAGAAQATPAASDYVMMAGASDQYEIQSSKLVLTSTKNPALRKFANEMIADHMKSTSMVKSAAMKAGMHPAAPMLDADGQSMMSQLQGTMGADRDMMYVSQQKTAHGKALALQQDYSMNGDSAPLKMAAAKIVPVVEHHKSELDGMPAMPGM